jgi:hypothetical protein
MQQTDETESSTALETAQTGPSRTSKWFGFALISTVAVVAGLVIYAAIATPI